MSLAGARDKRDDVDLNGRLWTIPATKNDEEHKVPLSDPAVAVLKSVKALGVDPELVFPSLSREGQALSNNAMLALLDRMGHGDVTVHGMRSTFRDWAAECTNFPRELAEKALAHTIGDETERAYQRGDLLNKRRKLMEAWASSAQSLLRRPATCYRCTADTKEQLTDERLRGLRCTLSA